MAKIKKKAHAARKQSEPQIAGILHRVQDFFATYRRTILPAAAAAAAAALIIAAYFFYQSLQDRKASPLTAAAYEYYSPAGNTPPDYKKALDLFRDIHQKYAGTMSGAVARYYAGNSLMALGQREAALKEYQNFVKEYSGEKLLLGLVYQRMGFAYTEQGQQAEAIEAFEQSEGLQGPGLATRELARLYEAAGNKEAAQEKYKLLAEKLPGTPWAFEAMAKLPPPALSPAPQPSPVPQAPAQK